MRGCSGGHAWLLWGACMVALGGHAWLLWGGTCVVAPGGHAWDIMRYGQQAGSTHPTGMHSCFNIIIKQVVRGCSGRACVVALGRGGMRGIRRDTVNERVVRILLECILV